MQFRRLQVTVGIWTLRTHSALHHTHRERHSDRKMRRNYRATESQLCGRFVVYRTCSRHSPVSAAPTRAAQSTGFCSIRYRYNKPACLFMGCCNTGTEKLPPCTLKLKFHWDQFPRNFLADLLATSPTSS